MTGRAVIAMARPRKDAAEPCARARLIEAFWDLAKQGSDAELSVGAVARAAGYNRGTFYYHFKDIEELRGAAVDGLLLGDGALIESLWCAAVEGDIDALTDGALDTRLHRLIVAMESGSVHLVNRIVRQAALDRWTRIACPDGGELAPDACFAIQFMVSGIMSLVVAVGYAHEGASPHPVIEVGSDARAYLADVAAATVAAVAAAQGMDPNDLMQRLQPPNVTER